VTVKPALSASRATLVLDFLASHPRQSFTLAELARALAVNAPSTQAVLLALTERGYVARDDRHRTYALGPAVVVLGEAALVRHPVVRAAREEMELLAEDVTAQFLGNVVIGDGIVAVVNQGRPRRPLGTAWLGARVPFTAPFGPVFAAYAIVEDRERWLASPERGAALRRTLSERLGVLRERGYAVEPEGPIHRVVGDAIERAITQPLDRAAWHQVRVLSEELVTQFAAAADAWIGATEISYVSVPVFSATVTVAMTITATGFAGPMTTTEVRAMAERMQATAEVISRRVFGIAPGSLEPGLG
jgi:DNA-binding IclR family transcriptional regulator